MAEFVYEERHIVLAKGMLEKYEAQSRSETWPALRQSDGNLVCLLAGLIGDPAEHLLQIVRYPGIEAWQAGQQAYDVERAVFIERETVRLFRQAGPRPQYPVISQLRRPVYGYRRFLVPRQSVDEFVHCSVEGLWPGIEPRGASIFGMWSAVAATDPQAMMMLTGYDGPGEWESTRYETGMPEGYDKALWDKALRLRARRNELTLRTWVRLMRAIEFAPGL